MVHQFTDIELDQLAAETLLLSLGDVIPLKFMINSWEFQQEVAACQQDWVPYLPRSDRQNNRQGLGLRTLPDAQAGDGVSFREAWESRGRQPLTEMAFDTPTPAYGRLPSLHGLFDAFSPVGRSFLVRCNMGGWFFPHRDDPKLFRHSMRLIVFLTNSRSHQYDFVLDDRKVPIEEGRAYYINTRKVHRSVSYFDDSTHLIMNIAPTYENATRIAQSLQHGW